MKDIIMAIVSNEAFLNAVITAIAALASYGIAKLFAAKPEWAKYEGLLITAVKAAEKIIPDDVANKSLARADAALRVFVERYRTAYGKFPKQEIIDIAKAALPIVHDRIDAEGNL
jgi:hypothetical protein